MVFVWGVTVLRAALLNRWSPTALSCFLRVYRPLYFPNDLRWPYLSLFEERYGRKTRLVVASSTSFVLPLGAKAQSFHCSSSPHQTHFVGLWRGPCPKAALWNLAFYTGVRRGDVRASYEFARVQLTRFRPARGVLRTASTDSIVLLQLRRIRNIYRITVVVQTRKLGGCVSATHSTAAQHAEARG